ncbi:hypothetical protein TNCV_4925231 [Trichonephila clavipes]|nr:hypothetical protein TNCV_4925231 [Trichonephila clavipes]
MDHIILNHGQVLWTTLELAPPVLTATPHQWEDASALDRFNEHRFPTRGPNSPAVLNAAFRRKLTTDATVYSGAESTKTGQLSMESYLLLRMRVGSVPEAILNAF